MATREFETMPYAVKHLFHSTNWVPDLEESTEFFRRVFGRQSTILGEYLGGRPGPVASGYPRDYATFTPIAEVQFECVNPALLVIDGIQHHKSVSRPHLGGLAWFVDGIEDLWSELRQRKMRGMDQRNRIIEGDGPLPDVSATPIIFTLPDDTGLIYEFCVYSPRLDPRGDPPVAAISPSDPLGIECCSHHTVLTDCPERAERLLVDVLGGRITHQGRNELLEAESTYIALADGVLELARPTDEASPAMETWRKRAPHDTYYSLTWKVRDLDRAGNHLRVAGAGLQAHSDTALVINPADGLGVAWGFTSVLSPGDPRAEQ
jgi:catechol 2,3-dioxygenase-like lactoylglutathione lyase family enzyme